MRIYCSYPDCGESIKNKHRKPRKKGWYFDFEDNMVFCPEHLPTYVLSERLKEFLL